MPSTTPDHGTVLRRLLEAMVVGDADIIAEAVTEDVRGWSPNLLVTSRQGLIDATRDRADGLTNVETTISMVYVVGATAIAEWRISADHTGRYALDDDLILEATGRRIHVAGATFAEFEGDRVNAFRSYFDDLALLEQVLVDA